MAGARRATPGALETVLRAQADVLGAANASAAAQRLVDGLAQRLALDLVALAFVQGERLQQLHVSAGTLAPVGSPLARQLVNAMHEALDQRCGLLTPLPPGQTEAVPRIRAAQQQLLDLQGGSLVCVLLQPHAERDSPHAPPPLGVLCAMRQQGDPLPLEPSDLRLLQNVAAFATPALGLLRAQDQRLRTRLQRRLGWRVPLHQRRTRQLGSAALALALVAALQWPAPHRVGGTAKVQGTEQRLLVAPHAGFLQQVHVRPGDHVRAGQLLVEMADPELRTERDRWASQLEQAQSSVAEANARADRTQLVMQMAKAAEAQAQLDLVQSQLDRTRITAPFDAVVLQGDLSQRLGTPLELGAELLTLAPAGHWRVVVAVDERDIGDVAVGQTGTLALSALPWDTLDLRVARITPMATAQDGHNVFEVEAELLDPPPGLRPGLVGRARIDVGQRALAAGLLQAAAQRARQAWWWWWG
jgi:RND family efflux transporter MFP subunit